MSYTWSFADTDLSSYGKITVLDDDGDIPDSRSGNVEIPYRHGAVHVDKYFAERILTIGIAIIGEDAEDLEALIDDLKGLLAPRGQQTLSNEREDGSIREVQATVDRSINPKRLSDRIAKVVIPFTLASPFFRSDTDIDDNETTINANPKAMVFSNPGTVGERDATIILTGPLQNTVITNSTNGCILTYTGTIASPRVVTISTNDTGEYVATDDLGNNVIGNITHSGAPALMVFDVGPNTLSIADSTHTTGKVKVVFKAPYL